MSRVLLVTLALWSIGSALPLHEIIFPGDDNETIHARGLPHTKWYHLPRTDAFRHTTNCTDFLHYTDYCARNFAGTHNLFKPGHSNGNFSASHGGEDSLSNFHLLVPFSLDDSYTISELTAPRPHASAVGPRDPPSRQIPPSRTWVTTPWPWGIPVKPQDVLPRSRDEVKTSKSWYNAIKSREIPPSPRDILPRNRATSIYSYDTSRQLGTKPHPTGVPNRLHNADVNNPADEPFSDIPSIEFTLDSDSVKKDLSNGPFDEFLEQRAKYHSPDKPVAPRHKYNSSDQPAELGHQFHSFDNSIEPHLKNPSFDNLSGPRHKYDLLDATSGKRSEYHPSGGSSKPRDDQIATRWIEAMCRGHEVDGFRSLFHHEHVMCGVCCVLKEIGGLLADHYDADYGDLVSEDVVGGGGGLLLDQLGAFFSGRRNWSILNSQLPSRSGALLL